MENYERLEFSNRLKKLLLENSDINCYAIIVNKCNVQEHIRNDANKLYNYMVKLSLIDKLKQCDNVKFHPDPRSIKITSGDSLHDYLQTELWFTEGVSTIIKTEPLESSASRNIQFADMLAGVIQSNFEDGNSEAFNIISNSITYNKLFF